MIRLRSSAVLVTVASVLATGAYAGTNKPGAIPFQKIEAQPNATPRFGCELRPFDLSRGLFCYGPAAIRSAYGLNGLVDNGGGRGQTIVILDAFGSPFVEEDLGIFDGIFGLPPPPSFRQITMPGTPPFDPANANIVGWTQEIALDVEWAHAIAPNANIVLVAAASNSDADLLDGLNFALDNHIGSVVSMSFGQSEAGLGNPDGLDIIDAWDEAFAKARDQRVTLFVSSGDDGSNTGGLPFQNVGFPASSPLVTSVGGTNLFFGSATAADPNGTYQSEQVWNDLGGAGGGGMSALEDEPGYQRDNVPASINKTLHRRRGVPDVAYNAGVVGGVIVAWAANHGGGFFLFGGTSAGAPQWAGIAADINQARGGKPLGFINERLYKLGRKGALNASFHDVTVGDNGIDVDGFPAARGFDLATGWGTPNFGTITSLMNDDD